MGHFQRPRPCATFHPVNSSPELLSETFRLLRLALVAVAAVAAGVALVSYAIRTRRISPFSGVARFFRANVDPLLRPVEGRVVRAGGNPASAPWWMLGAVVVGGIVLVSALEFIVGQVQFASSAVGAGPRGLYQLVVTWAVAILRIALIARVVSSWFGISPYSRWMRWAFTLTEPILAPLRRVIPSIGMIDITPIIAYFVLGLLGAFLVRLV
jgi:YggT family protein